MKIISAGDLCPASVTTSRNRGLCVHVSDQSEQSGRRLKTLANVPPDDGLSESKSYFSSLQKPILKKHHVIRSSSRFPLALAEEHAQLSNIYWMELVQKLPGQALTWER